MRRIHAHAIVLILFVVMMGHMMAGAGEAGKIADFEEAAGSRGQSTSAGDSTLHHGDDEDSSEGCLEGCCTFLGSRAFELAAATGINAWDRVKQGDRETGELLLPFVRVDVTYQDVESDVEAVDYLVEVGYGPVGLLARTTHYWKADPDDELDISQLFLLWRMFLDIEGVNLGADLGAGWYIIGGDGTASGGAFIAGITVEPLPHFAVEAKHRGGAINGNYVSDTDLSALATWRYVSLRAGYRILAVGSETLNGPFIGVSVRY